MFFSKLKQYYRKVFTHLLIIKCNIYISNTFQLKYNKKVYKIYHNFITHTKKDSEKLSEKAKRKKNPVEYEQQQLILMKGVTYCFNRSRIM